MRLHGPVQAAARVRRQPHQVPGQPGGQGQVLRYRRRRAHSCRRAARGLPPPCPGQP